MNRAPAGLGLAASILALHIELLAGGTRAKGPPLRGVAITARRAGALLTGLATALAVGSRRSGVVITAPTSGAIFQASASLRPSIREHVDGYALRAKVRGAADDKHGSKTKGLLALAFPCDNPLTNGALRKQRVS